MEVRTVIYETEDNTRVGHVVLEVTKEVIQHFHNIIDSVGKNGWLEVVMYAPVVISMNDDTKKLSRPTMRVDTCDVMITFFDLHTLEEYHSNSLDIHSIMRSFENGEEKLIL